MSTIFKNLSKEAAQELIELFRRLPDMDDAELAGLYADSVLGAAIARAREEIWDTAHYAGYDEGEYAGSTYADEIRQAERVEGYGEGYDQGASDGHDKGYENGYADALSEYNIKAADNDE